MYKDQRIRHLAVGIQSYPNIQPADSDYPDGSIRDKTLSLPGTLIGRISYNDIHQFFAKLLRLAGITASGIPDNEYSGFQYIDAVKKLFARYGSVVTLSSSYVIPSAANGQDLYNPLLHVTPGSPSGITITLPGNVPAPGGSITVVNDSSHDILIESLDWELDYIPAIPTATFTLPSKKSMELVFLIESSQNLWIVSRRP